MLGTMGDLGTNPKWDDIIPSNTTYVGYKDLRSQMKSCEKTYGKKKLGDIVGLVNARE